LADGGVSFEVPDRRSNVLTGAILGLVIVLMLVVAAVLFWNMLPPAENPQEMQAQMEAARQQFGTALSQSIAATANHKNVSVSSKDDALLFVFTSEGPKAARHDGLVPFEKNAFFREFLGSHTETELCSMGFKRLGFSANGNMLTQQSIDCAAHASTDDSR
jgi:hypothetical protein